jgi:hypothetical protein
LDGIAIAESIADGSPVQLDDLAVRAALGEALVTTSDVEYSALQAALATLHTDAFEAATETIDLVEYVFAEVGYIEPCLREFAELLRCSIGNPFGPAAFDPEWRTATVVQLAQGIYDDRAFDRLPILADALQDAGCDHPNVLTHCRDTGPHARGCWVVDLILGKA